MPGSTRPQLFIAKSAVIAVAALIAGFFLGREEGDYVASVLVMAAVFGTMAGVYELLSAWLASLFGGAPEDPADIVAEAAGPALSFRPADALKVLGTFIGAQVVVWVTAVLFVMDPRASHDPGAVGTAAVLRVFPVALPLSMILSALAVYALTRRFVRRMGPDAVRISFALERADAQPTLVAAGAGFSLAVLLVIIALVTPVGSAADQGLLAQMLASSAAGRIVFALAAVLIAPPVEEYVFRGVLLGTLLPLGEVAAGAISGLAFWLLHATEWAHYWPAAIGVGAMTVLVTRLRLRTKSIVPSVVAHLCYNGTLTLVALVG
jgi:membrane protease YdiL (CAAX protease family)